MAKWKNKDVVLKVPQRLARDIERMGKKDYPPKKWSDKARDLLYSCVATHKEQ